MHNLGTVIRFEVVRTLKKKSFWLMAIGFPLMMVVIFGIIFMSNKSTNDAVKDLEKQQFSLAITDESHLVNPEMIKSLKATTYTTKQQGIEAVKSGAIDGYIYYPVDIAKQPVEVYGKDTGIFNNGRYGSVAKALITNSVQSTVSPQVSSVIKGSTQTTVTTTVMARCTTRCNR